MSSVNEKIMSRLKKAEEPQRKSLSIPFKIEDIRNLDAIAKAITQYSDRTTTRNMLIEDAVESFIEDAVSILADEGIDLDVEDNSDFDTVVFPALMDEGYEDAFFNEHQWYYVRVAKFRIPKIRYIALYVGAPQSSIEHYAKVAPNGFIYDEHEKKYRIILDGDPIRLPRPIPLGNAAPMATRSPKYTTLQKLFTATEFRELYSQE